LSIRKRLDQECSTRIIGWTKNGGPGLEAGQGLDFQDWTRS
jgi:hypothetical protein